MHSQFTPSLKTTASLFIFWQAASTAANFRSLSSLSLVPDNEKLLPVIELCIRRLWTPLAVVGNTPVAVVLLFDMPMRLVRLCGVLASTPMSLQLRSPLQGLCEALHVAPLIFDERIGRGEIESRC